ncbi:MAG: cytochrome c [Acidobacteriota bacterium]
MKTRLLVILISFVVLFSTGFFATTRESSAASPTFSKDVAPILYKNCATCHRAGSIAPMSLFTYQETRPWSKSIREQVITGQMPPWHATDPHGTFLNDRRLSEAEKDILVRWVDAGSPQGNPKDLPQPPSFSDDWEIGKPDVVLSMANEYTVPEDGTISYQYFPVPTKFKEDKWIQAIEVKPGARSVVHHVLVFVREPDGKGRPMPFKQVIPNFSISRGGAGSLIATTAPGTNAMTYKPGEAILVKAGAVLLLQMHYTTNGTAAKDKTSVGMIFAKQPPQMEIITSAFINPMFVIPPGASNHQVDSAIEFTEDSHILGLVPHTHLRGKSWSYRLVFPDGRKENVLSVPKYDFNWQTYYMFAKPLAAPKGARLEATAHYDNSTANLFNPDPRATVRWGDQTWEEMQYTGITYTIDKPKSQITTQGNR